MILSIWVSKIFSHKLLYFWMGIYIKSEIFVYFNIVGKFPKNTISNNKLLHIKEKMNLLIIIND